MSFLFLLFLAVGPKKSTKVLLHYYCDTSRDKKCMGKCRNLKSGVRMQIMAYGFYCDRLSPTLSLPAFPLLLTHNQLARVTMKSPSSKYFLERRSFRMENYWKDAHGGSLFYTKGAASSAWAEPRRMNRMSVICFIIKIKRLLWVFISNFFYPYIFNTVFYDNHLFKTRVSFEKSKEKKKNPILHREWFSTLIFSFLKTHHNSKLLTNSTVFMPCFMHWMNDFYQISRYNAPRH